MLAEAEPLLEVGGACRRPPQQHRLEQVAVGSDAQRGWRLAQQGRPV